jgi:serine/threonine-protein kinase
MIDQLPAGSSLSEGRYRLDEVIGRGGAATVYRALDTVLGVQRAVKVLQIPLHDAEKHEAMRHRLRTEARALAVLEHPNIVRIYDVGRQDDVDFVVMELADGGSLEGMRRREGRLSPSHATAYGLQVLSGLAAAHAAGIVHRDVKPSNVLLDRRGVAKLADFGIALLVGDGSRMTRTGQAMGTIAYMAPEQRVDARGVSAPADVYATGAMLYTLITGRNPVDLFTADASSDRWREVPQPLRSVLVAATRYDPRRRYVDARAFALALLAIAEDLSALGPAPEPPEAERFPAAAAIIAGTPLPAFYDPNAPANDATTAAITLLGPTDLSTVTSGPRIGWMVWGGFGLAVAAALVFALAGPLGPRPAEHSPRGVSLPPLAVGSEVEAVVAPVPAVPDDPPIEAPAPRAASKAKSAAARPPGPAPLGSWSGSVGGFIADLELGGDLAAPAGTFGVKMSGGDRVASAVSGTWRPSSRALTLHTGDGGLIEATLSADKRRLEGRVESTDGQVQRLSLVPERP